MQRILILGSPGTGKSTLAKKLSHTLQLPLYHLDQLFFEENWVINRDVYTRSLQTILKQDQWIIDGNYVGSLSERLICSDTVIYLDYPTSTALLGVTKRYFKYKHTTRPDMAPGCVEKLRLSFLFYVLTFKRKKKQKTFTTLETKHIPVYIFKSRKETNAFLNSLAANNS